MLPLRAAVVTLNETPWLPTSFEQAWSSHSCLCRSIPSEHLRKTFAHECEFGPAPYSARFQLPACMSADPPTDVIRLLPTCAVDIQHTEVPEEHAFL